MKIGGGISLSKKTKKKKKPRPRVMTTEDIDEPFRNLPDALDFEAYAAAAEAIQVRDKKVRDETGKKILQLRSSTPPIDIPPRTRAPSPEVMALDARQKIEAWRQAKIERNKKKFEEGLEEREVHGYCDDSIFYDKEKIRKRQLENTHGSESLPSEDILDILKGEGGGKRRKKRTKRRKPNGKHKTKRRRKLRKSRFKKKRTKRRRRKKTKKRRKRRTRN